MKFEIAANMHLYLEIDENINREQAENDVYDILGRLQKEIEGLSYTIHEVEVREN